ncbi:hypothetical protein Y600_6340 [Burkholderia pseudomallei MSHR3709]|nr:hypothetical protein Y600_6340 [Burkholderia pseudomallei MSHR3709]
MALRVELTDSMQKMSDLLEFMLDETLAISAAR